MNKFQKKPETQATANTVVAKKEYKLPENHVGYLKESEKGFQILVVEQNIQLSKGDKIILKAPQDEVDSLQAAGYLTEEQAEDRKSKIPEWKLAVAKVLPKRDN